MDLSIYAGILFCLGWYGLLAYMLFAAAKLVEINLHNAPTNCTVAYTRINADSGLDIYVNYIIPGEQYNRTGILWPTELDSTHTVNETFPCFYALNDHSTVMEKSHPNDAGNIAFLVFAIIFCAPFVAVVLLLTARKAWNVLKPFFQDISETATKVVTMSKIKPEKAHNECDTSSSDSSKRNSISSHLIVPVEYSKSVFGNSISWLKARIAWSRLNTSQQQDAYNLEDQESCTTRASSNYSFRTTKKLLSYSKGLRGDASDQNSIETNSL